MTLTTDQRIALDLAEAWWRRPDRSERPFRLDGYAGTGKTFVAEHLVERIGVHPSRVLALAPTGRAARVFALRTGWPASTIHRALYVPIEDPAVTTALAKLEAATEPEEIEAARKELADAEAEAEVGWSKSGSDLSRFELVVVDEAAMVGRRLAKDLRALEKPLMLLGDPGQLPPVNDRPGFADVEPKRTLTEVMRQDAGSTILDAAMAVRRGEPIPAAVRGEPGSGSAFVVAPPRSLDDAEYAAYDVVLAGTHRVRRGFNRRLRRFLGYDDDPTPKRGEKLVVKRNDYRFALFNGQVVDVTDDAEPIDEMTAVVPLRDDTGRELEVKGNVLRLRDHFERVDVHTVRGAIDLDYAYALTVHAAQGSEWESVCVLDDWPGNDHDRWLYTALTRGSRHVTLVTR